MKILVKSKFEIESLNTIHEPHVIISIRHPIDIRPKVQKNNKTIDVLYLKFDDIDDISEPHAFTAYHASKIMRFLNKYKGLFETIVVHCLMGISRSAGVAAALSCYYNGSDSEFFKTYKPNLLVKKYLLEEMQFSNFG